MKKYIIGIVIVTLLIITLAGFLFEKSSLFKGGNRVLGTQTQKTVRISSSQIKANAKKYQPQGKDTNTSALSDVSAVSAIVVDETNNKILFAKNVHAKRPPASITKVVSLAIALENLKKDQLINVSQMAADMEPNKIVMKAGEKLKAEDLFYGMMMISANDAARAVAEAVPGGYEKFIELMNQKAYDLGLTGSHFENPAGLDEEGHVTTVFDIATFVRYDLLTHPEFVNYAGEKGDHSVFPTDHNESHWWSHISHMLYAYPGMIAAKTGYTDTAKSTYVGVAERNGRRVTVVMMGATNSSANNDVKALLDYGFAQK